MSLRNCFTFGCVCYTTFLKSLSGGHHPVSLGFYFLGNTPLVLLQPGCVRAAWLRSAADDWDELDPGCCYETADARRREMFVPPCGAFTQRPRHNRTEHNYQSQLYIFSAIILHPPPDDCRYNKPDILSLCHNLYYKCRCHSNTETVYHESQVSSRPRCEITSLKTLPPLLPLHHILDRHGTFSQRLRQLQCLKGRYRKSFTPSVCTTSHFYVTDDTGLDGTFCTWLFFWLA